MRILITGATGYIGSNLFQSIIKNPTHKLLLPYRDNKKINELINKVGVKSRILTIRVSRNDDFIEFQKVISKFKPELVIHLATHYVHNHSGTDDINKLFHSNLLFSTKLIEFCANAGCKKFIYTSTVWKNYHNTDSPVNLYAATKNAFEEILKYYQSSFRLQIINIYLSDTYGETDTRNKLIPLLIRTARSNKKIQLSPSNNRIEILHINDVIELYFEIIDFIKKSRTSFIYNYYPRGESFTLKNLIIKFKKASDSNLFFEFNKKPYRFREIMYLSKRKSSFKLKWKPKRKFTKTIKQIFQK